jgi:mono/diheme cytochrome c family protein
LAESDAGEEGIAMIGSGLIGTSIQRAALLSLLAFASTALAQTPTDAQLKKGQEVYQYWCWNCHGSGAGKPGTEALRAKYKDARPADLEQRTDLAPVVIKTFVRKGVSIMPIFRKTEISDAELDALAAYLARNSKAKSAN